jgi:DNA polymerase V
VFVMTDRFKNNYYYNAIHCVLPESTNYTPDLINAAFGGLKKMYKEGYMYKKAGVMVSGLSNSMVIPVSLFSDKQLTISKRKKQTSIMQKIDYINQKFGNNSVQMASSGFAPKWVMKSTNRTPRYTTVWEEILKVK